MTPSHTRRIRHAGHAVMLMAALLSAGCLSDRPGDGRPDPLTGIPRSAAADPRGVASTFLPAERSIPPANPATSPIRQPETVSSLGIHDGRSSDADRGPQATNAWTGSEARAATPGRTANLGGPREATSPANYTHPNNAASVGVRIRSFEEAQQFLTAHGVKYQELKMTGQQEWQFSCSVASRGGASTVRTYEVRDRYGLVAMQKVIDQIIRDQAR